MSFSANPNPVPISCFGGYLPLFLRITSSTWSFCCLTLGRRGSRRVTRKLVVDQVCYHFFTVTNRLSGNSLHHTTPCLHVDQSLCCTYVCTHLDHMVTSCIQYFISVGVLSHCLFPQTSGNNQEQWYNRKEVHLSQRIEIL